MGYSSLALSAVLSRWAPCWQRWSAIALLAACAVGGTSPEAKAQTSRDIELKVGVVQRFGAKANDKLTLKAQPGDRLTLRFQTNGKTETLEATTMVIEAQPQPLTEKVVQERVVLSTHRSFESAEDSANQWRSRGIEVEIAQPGNWQVWAKRSVYSTPLLRRLLLRSIEMAEISGPFLDSQTLTAVPKSSWVVNGYRYNRDEVDITAGQGLIRVEEGPDGSDRSLYAGSLRLQPNTYGTYTLVNFVPLETYLRGVVPHEIGAGAPQNAIEAQAILARTYALRNLRRFAVDNYELCADTQCQVYWGLDGTTPQTDRAIAATRGLVLTYQDELVDALYSSTTGGVTASFTDVWNGTPRPYLRPVVDSVNNVWNLAQQDLSDEQAFRRFIQIKQGFNEDGWKWLRWREEGSLQKLNQDLRAYLQAKKNPLASFQTIQQVQVSRRSPSGRVQQMQVTTDKGVVTLEKDELLRAFETPNSTLFYLDPLYQSDQKTLRGYAFVGGGLGHGVGMSQTGSYRLAELGWSSDRILSFYFPETQLQPISPAITFWREPQDLQTQAAQP